GAWAEESGFFLFLAASRGAMAASNALIDISSLATGNFMAVLPRDSARRPPKRALFPPRARETVSWKKDSGGGWTRRRIPRLRRRRPTPGGRRRCAPPRVRSLRASLLWAAPVDRCESRNRRG